MCRTTTPLEAYWRTYFSSIFNPARLKIGAMTSENAEEILAEPARSGGDS